VLLAATTLNGCGWFDGKASPLQSAPLRPGVDRQTTANGLPPAPNRGNYDAGVIPLEDSRNQPIGSIVATKGGQKAQLEAAEKERAERAKERAQRDAERKEREKTEEKPDGAPPAAAPAEQVPAPAPVPEQAPVPAPVPEPATPPAQR
jgi:hypothetical protein